LIKYPLFLDCLKIILPLLLAKAVGYLTCFKPEKYYIQTNLNMRYITFLSLILVAIMAGTSCTKNNNTDVRDAIVANYTVTETWTENGKAFTKPPFNMSVEKSSQQEDMILLNNFADYGAGVTAEATISGELLTIPQQTLTNLKAISGSGTIKDTLLTFTYIETYNSLAINISVRAKKK